MTEQDDSPKVREGKRLLARIQQRGRELGYASRRQLSIAATGSPSTLDNLNRGRMPRGDTLRKIADALHVTPDWFSPDGVGNISDKGRSISYSHTFEHSPRFTSSGVEGRPFGARDLPVYATTAGEMAGVFMLYERVTDHLERPRALDGATDAYAVYVPDNAMAPRYQMGELIYVHPGRPVTVGCYALVYLAGDADEPAQMIARVDGLNESAVTLRQFHKEQPIVCAREVIRDLHRIVLGGEG